MFTYFSSTRQNPTLQISYPVENGQTVSYGDMIRIVNGRVRGAQTNTNDWIGCCASRGTFVGDVDGTIVIDVVIDPGGIYEVEQGAIPDAQCQAGDHLDINPQHDGLAALANDDLVVVNHEAVPNLVYVQIVNHAYH